MRVGEHGVELGVVAGVTGVPGAAPGGTVDFLGV